MKYAGRIIRNSKLCERALQEQSAREAEQLAATDRDTPGKPHSQHSHEHRCKHGTLTDHCPDCAP